MDHEPVVDLFHERVDRLARERVGIGDDLLGEGVRVVGDARFQGHAADRRASVGDDPLDGVALATDAEGLGEHGLDVRAAPDVGVADGGVPGGRRQDDLTLTERAVRLAKALGGGGLIEAGQIDRADPHAGQHPIDVLLVVRVHGTRARDRGEQQPDNERDGEAQPARGRRAALIRNGDPDGIGRCGAHGSDILAVRGSGPIKARGSMMTPR